MNRNHLRELKRTMMERLCAISEIGASYFVCKRYVQELHYQQELLHLQELQHQRDQDGKTKKPQESLET